MGKGDIKTKKGKIARGSYGITRKRKKKAVVIEAKPKKAAKKPAAKKAPAKKAAPKKAAAKKTEEQKFYN